MVTPRDLDSKLIKKTTLGKRLHQLLQDLDTLLRICEKNSYMIKYLMWVILVEIAQFLQYKYF